MRKKKKTSLVKIIKKKNASKGVKWELDLYKFITFLKTVQMIQSIIYFFCLFIYLFIRLNQNLFRLSII